MIAVILRQRNNHFIMAVSGQKKLWSLSKMTIKLWRRRRDLNPRAGFPTYALSRGASSPLEYFCIMVTKIKNMKLCWRRGWDSNPRSLAGSLVFKTSSLNHSDTSPNCKRITINNIIILSQKNPFVKHFCKIIFMISKPA